MGDKHSFDSCFEVFLADTEESRRIHYNLRYQVYCEEMGFEDKEQYSQQMEFDEWDRHSVHFLVRHRYSGQWLGALRVVYPYRATFPFEEKCVLDATLTARQYAQSIEISRLCVVKEARRFAPKNGLAHGASAELDSRDAGNVRSFYDYKNQCRSIMWGLYRAALVYSRDHGIKNWFILVTPSLAHCVRREGFEMRQVGGACNHRGQRIPYTLNVDDILENPFWNNGYQCDYRKFSELSDQVALRQRA